MVEDRKHTDQTDMAFIQNVFDQIEPEYASPELKARILSAAPTGKRPFSFAKDMDELMSYLWPFGAIWRPAAGLAMAAVMGVMLGLTDPLSAINTLESDEAMTEEIVAFSTQVQEPMEGLQ